MTRSTRRPLRVESLEDRCTPATFTVTSLADDGLGTLRNMIDLANVSTGADTIVFDPAIRGQTVTLTTFFDPPAGTFAGPTGLIVLDGLTIQGTGETITRGGTDAFRLLFIAPSKIVNLRNLTLSNGIAQGGFAGAGGGGGAGMGGAIFNEGIVFLANCTLTGNQARGGAGGSTALDFGKGGGGLSGRRPLDPVNGVGPNGGVAGGTPAGFGGGGGGGDFGVGNQPQNGGFGGGGGGGTGGFGGGFGGFGAGGGGGGGFGGGSGGFAGFGAGFGGGNGGAGGGGAGLGGAIFTLGGPVIITNSTIAGNSVQGGISEGPNGAAVAGQVGGGFGGGIFSLNGALTMVSVTVANNSVADGIGSGLPNTADGGAVYSLSDLVVGTPSKSLGANVSVANSILTATSGGSDVVNHKLSGSATIDGAGPNLVSVVVVNTGGTVTGTPFTVADAKLGPLAANGWLTRTLAPLAGSPAIDAGDNARVSASDLHDFAPFFDQRGQGFVRISNARVDLGAVELQVPVVVAPATLPNGRVGAGYAQTLAATGPVGPFTFLETFGPLAPPTPPSALPPGLTLSTGGAVTGTPTAAGTFTFTVRATNATGEFGAKEYTVTVSASPLVKVPVLVGGPTDGSARVLADAGGTLTFGNSLSMLPGLGASARVAVADVTGDGVPDRIAGAGPGAASRVAVFDGASGALLTSFQAFEATFTGGVFVAAADIDGDGKAEVVVTPDESGGPVVAVYAGSKLAAGLGGEAAQVARFFGIAGDPNFRGGVRPTLADANRDGAADLMVSAGVSGGPRIALFDGKSVVTGVADPRRLLPDFFAFESTLRNGAFVAAGDVTGDGAADLAFGGGPGGAPRVRLFDGLALLAAGPFANLDAVGAAQRANFFAGDSALRGGVRLALADTDGDGKADLVTGSGAGEVSRVRAYKSATLLAGGVADQELDPFGGVALAGGVYVG